MTPGDALPTLRLFVSSPGDVAEERAVALAVIRRLQGHFQGRLRLVPILWEQEPLLATAGFQEEIDRRVPPSAADVALFILWSRLGTPLSPTFALEDGRRPTGTEWEFEDATQAARSERGLPHILVYRKDAPPLLDARQKERVVEGLAQIEAVQAFFERHFRDAQSLAFTGSFHRFVDASALGQALDEHLTRLLTERVERAGPAGHTWVGTPFRGLESFEAAHASVFFGRTRAIQQVRQALARQVRDGRAFVLILGPSGNGKSSLARAGLLPLLTGPWVVEEGVVGGFCRQALLRPADGRTPMVALAQALTRPGVLPDLATRGGPDALAGALAEGPKAAVALVRGALEREAARVAGVQRLASPPPARLVLLVDQLEELFTREGLSEADREAFARVLSALATSGDVWVLATLRSDFYPAFARLAPLMALKQGHGQFDLPAPDAAEVAQVVRGPAAAAGLRYEVDAERGRSLDEVLVEEGVRGADALPLLEFLLTQLWERREQGHRLTFAAYDALGGLTGALSRHAEATWAALSPAERAAFPGLVRALVEVGEGADAGATRRRAPAEEVGATAGGRALTDALVKARLLTAEGQGEGAVVTVAHEALLRAWPRLAERLAAEADLLRIRSRLRSASARWAGQGRESSLLLATGKPLEEARLLGAAGFHLTALESEFVRASEARARRLGLLKRAAVAAIVLLALVAGWLALEADGARRSAEALRDRTLADSARIEDLSSLRAVLASRDTLFPVSEADVARATDLIARAQATLTRLSLHEQALAGLEARALERPAQGQPGEERGWRFADAADAASHRVLAEVVREGRALRAPQRDGQALNTLALLTERFTPATTEPPGWEAVIAEIADPARCPAYRGLRIVPQFGLHPLGKDPASGLHEFAHLYSGRLPVRGPDGSLVYREDACVVFVLIPAGSFWMGAARAGDRDRQDRLAQPSESPAHEVTLEPYFLAKHECTQAQWARLTGGQNPSWYRPGGPARLKEAERTLRRPVETVSWDDVLGIDGWLLRYGLTLPTEAQWEYAVRAGTSTPWSFGDYEGQLREHGRHLLGGDAWSGPVPVGEKRPNPWGLLDMYGNVKEWCADDWHEDYEGAPTNGSAWIDRPRGGLRVRRGGGHRDEWASMRSRSRSVARTTERWSDSGFRPAMAVMTD